MGAGLSGVLMGIQLIRRGFDDFIIYERQNDVGGTWLRNTYPGLHCDVPSHLYCYSFEPNPDWSTVHASQPEIQAYIRACADKHGLLPKIRFGTPLESATFDEAAGAWHVKTDANESFSHRWLVSATGGLTEPNLPRIDGLDQFNGESWHSGAWRHDIDLTDKTVAIIGTAASAVQVVPEVARNAKHLTVFQRSPNWVMPRNNQPYTRAQQAAFQSPAHLRRHWRKLYRRTLTTHRAFQRDPRAIRTIRTVGLKHMQSAINDPKLLAAVTPDYDPGCKRIVVSDEYYPALAMPHVELVAEAVRELTEDSVVTVSGDATPTDIVIFCTCYKLGSRASGKPQFEVIRSDGQTLTSSLAVHPQAYRGVAIPNFPNYFTVCGINGVVAYASFFASAEVCTEFIADRALEFFCDEYHSVQPDPSITRQYNDAIQSELQGMSWATGQCTNFYRDRSGRVLSFFPGSLARMRREMRRAGFDGFVVKPS